MKIIIQTEKYEMSDGQESYVTEKIESLKKYYDRITDEAVLVRVMIEKNDNVEQKQKLLIRVTMSVPKASFRAEVQAFTIEEGVDLIHDKLHRQIERYKTKHHKFEPISAASVADEVGSDVVLAEQFEQNLNLDDRIVKRKLFTDLIPMSETEALDTMLMLGHTFFIFVNSATDRYNVIYSRVENDGYGLVELEHQEGVTN